MKYIIVLLLLIGCTANSPLSQVESMQAVAPNGVFNLRASQVMQELAGIRFEAFAYNDQIPGPILKVAQNSTLTINFKNDLPMETAVHWHVVRVENKYDGAAGVTQEAIKLGD